MIADAFDALTTATFWVAVLRIATPLIFGTLGALLCERAGVLNLGIEGIMAAGAFSAWLVVYSGGSLWAGLLVAAGVGALIGLLHGGLTVTLGLSQHVAGLGITLLATSLTHYSYRVLFPSVSTPPTITPFAPLGAEPPAGWLADLAWIAPVLGQLTAPTLLALALVPILAWGLNRTPAGLAIRAVGDNPAAVDSAGLSVSGLRLTAVAAGSALMALGGAFLTTAAFNAYFFNMINGRGWICIALVVFASWRPGKALVGALLFAFVDALQLRLAQVAGDALPYQFWLMLPFILSIIALVLVSRRAAYPRALMKPYRKGER